jgi:hypothetical protein
MSSSNQEDVVARMVDTITLVTSSEQIKGMGESALEAIDGGAGAPSAPPTAAELKQLHAADKFVDGSDGDFDKARIKGGVVDVHSGEGGDWVPFSSVK